MTAGIIVNGDERIRFVAPLQVTSNQPAFVTDAMNLRQQVSKQNVQRWEITANLNMSNNDSDYLVHSVMNGHATPFEIEMPQVYRKSGATTATRSTVNAVANIGATSVGTNTVGLIVAGEFIQFSNHSKVYMVTSPRNGNGQLTFTPQLVVKADINTVIKFGGDVRMMVRYDPSVILGMIYTDGILSDPGSVKLVEAL